MTKESITKELADRAGARAMAHVAKLITELTPELSDNAIDVVEFVDSLFSSIQESLNDRIVFAQMVVFAIHRRDAHAMDGSQSQETTGDE